MKINLNIKMIETTPDFYVSDEGYVMTREECIPGDRGGIVWVLRAPDDSILDRDRYSNDIASRFGFTRITTEGVEF